MSAFLEEHEYADGYGRAHLNTPFWMVRCDDHEGGSWVLNSGHHYRADELGFARELAAQHDAREHVAS